MASLIAYHGPHKGPVYGLGIPWTGVRTLHGIIGYTKQPEAQSM